MNDRLRGVSSKIGRTPPPDFGCLPPWCPVPTFAAANYLGIHPKTLLRWHRLNFGPTPEPRGRYTSNVIYWQPAKLRSWWEAHYAPPGRTVDEIVFEWMQQTPRWAYRGWPFPARASGAVLRRRARARKAALAPDPGSPG